MLQYELYGMDRISVNSGDVLGITNDADVGPIAVSYSSGPARILRRAINQEDRESTHGRRATGRTDVGPEVGKVYEFSVVPFALEFSLNADVGRQTTTRLCHLTFTLYSIRSVSPAGSRLP